MIFKPLRLEGLWLVQMDRRPDPRGWFARSFCEAEFAAAGLPSRFPQCNLSRNDRRGTLRGMHWQAEPCPEGKLVRCSRGAIHDVVVDLRPASPTCRQWLGVDLTAEDGDALYVPPGFAHGFQTLTDEADVSYMMTESYSPGLARGARWDDPALAIAWPLPDPIVSDRDREHPLL